MDPYFERFVAMVLILWEEPKDKEVADEPVQF